MTFEPLLIKQDGPFLYKDFAFGRFVFHHSEWGAVIMVRGDNSVVAGRFGRDEMPEIVKYAFRPKWGITNSQMMASQGYYPDSVTPEVYVRGNEIHPNTYKTDSHRNEKVRYKAGQSKGQMRGLEQAGWVGYSRADNNQ